jgi:cytoskeletal protein CcmA (bactofilin family)
MKENEIHTIVGSNVKLTGTLKDINDIVVHGAVEGEVSSDQNIVIAETAKIKGPVNAQVVSVAGEIVGMIVAHEKLEIHPSGRVEGNIQTKDLIIHSGARFVGKSTLLTDDTAKGDDLPIIETSENDDTEGEKDDKDMKVEVEEE